jgi:hypothetical protein
VKRTELGPGKKALERGSTFKSRGEGLQRSAAKPRRSPISQASPAQRAKVRDSLGCIVTGADPCYCDPAHLWPRGMGGCDHPDCVVVLRRDVHRAFDDGELDILGELIAHGCWAELAHAVEVHHVDPIALLQRCTGERWAPERTAA